MLGQCAIENYTWCLVTAVGENYLACWELLWIVTDRNRHILLTNQYNGMGETGYFSWLEWGNACCQTLGHGYHERPEHVAASLACILGYVLHTHSHTRHRNWAGVQPSFGDLFMWHVVFHPHYGGNQFFSAQKVTSGFRYLVWFLSPAERYCHPKPWSY